MRKTVLATIILAALIALLSLAVSAQDYAPDKDGRYTIEYQGEANKEYALVVIAGDYTETETPELSAESIVYIDQLTADAEGIVRFDGIIPMTGTVGTVLIGGGDTPVKDGLLTTASGLGYIAGRLISYSGNAETLTLPESITTIGAGFASRAKSIKEMRLRGSAIDFEDGALTSSVKLFFSPLATAAKEYAVANGITYRLYGDFDDDKTVDGNDLNGMMRQFAIGGASTIPAAVFDLDFDGRVTLNDVSVLLKFLASRLADF